MSNVRIKIFSFDSTKIKEDFIEERVNEFLSKDDILVDPSDVTIMTDEYTFVTITYKLRKSHQKDVPKKSGSKNK